MEHSFGLVARCGDVWELGLFVLGRVEGGQAGSRECWSRDHTKRRVTLNEGVLCIHVVIWIVLKHEGRVGSSVHTIAVVTSTTCERVNTMRATLTDGRARWVYERGSMRDRVGARLARRRVFFVAYTGNNNHFVVRCRVRCLIHTLGRETW
jgi:hypothetical protein